MFDASITCQSFCDGNGTAWLNDFWFSGSLDASLVGRNMLIEHWSKCNFWHPGNLEGLWGYLKGTMSSVTIMPRRSLVVNNEYKSYPVRADRFENHNMKVVLEQCDFFRHGARMEVTSLNHLLPKAVHIDFPVPSYNMTTGATDDEPN